MQIDYYSSNYIEIDKRVPAAYVIRFWASSKCNLRVAEAS
jgi:hypothetical protein